MNRQIKKLTKFLNSINDVSSTTILKNWQNLLPLDEFTSNNIVQGFFKHTTLFANYNYHLLFDQFNFSNVENLIVKNYAI